MTSLADTIHKWEQRGYTENLVPRRDHFAVRSGEVEIFPKEFVVDKVVRFDNSSDPDDQAILYAISVPTKNIKGIYVDSYGSYHDDLSSEMLKRIQAEIERLRSQ